MALNNPEGQCIFDHPLYIEAGISRLRNLEAHFDIQSLRGLRVLETGCGTGSLGEVFEKAGCHVVSIDAREEFIEILRNRYPAREAAIVDLDRWDSAPLGRFDAVLCFGTLYHLAAPESFLIECTRLTDVILLETIVLDSPWPRCVRVSDHEPAGSFSGIGCWPSPTWITSIIERHGFSVQDISSPLANWGGEYPSVFDWEPRHDGQCRHGNTFLRKMWVFRRRSASAFPRSCMGQPPAQFESEILPLLLSTLGRTNLGGVRILDVGHSGDDLSAGLTSAGALVRHLALPDAACRAEANETAGFAASWIDGGAFDAVVLHLGAGVRYSYTAILHLLTVAPLLLVELAPGDPEAEDILRALDRAGYCLSQQTLRGQGSQAKALLTIRCREHTGTVLRPLLVHVHIHKCGGTSLNRLLEMSFAGRHFDHYPLDEGPFPKRDELVNLVLDRPEMASLSSHSIRIFPPIIGNRLPLYVAFLREPVQRFISHLTYCKKQYRTFPENLKQHWPANCPDLPLREMAAWMIDNQPEAVRQGALVTHFLTEQTWLDAVGGILKLSDRWLDRDSPLFRGFEPLKLALATAVLENFFFVGLVEEMETSMRVLRAKLRPYGLNLLDQPLPVENVSRELALDVDWLNPDDRVGRAVLAFLEHDLALYRRFRATVQSRWLNPRSKDASAAVSSLTRD